MQVLGTVSLGQVPGAALMAWRGPAAGDACALIPEPPPPQMLLRGGRCLGRQMGKQWSCCPSAGGPQDIPAQHSALEPGLRLLLRPITSKGTDGGGWSTVELTGVVKAHLPRASGCCVGPRVGPW